jgi:hypothetical protein
MSDFLQRQAAAGRSTENEFPTNEKDLLEAVQLSKTDTSMLLWFILLLRLAVISDDLRVEVRNGTASSN